MRKFFSSCSTLGVPLFLIFLVSGCGTIAPKDVPSAPSGGETALSRTATEKVQQNPWWFGPEYVDEANKGITWEYHPGKRESTVTTKEREVRGRQGPGQSASTVLETERVAVIIDGSLPIAGTLQTSFGQDRSWQPVIHIADVRKGIDRKEGGDLARTVSRHDWLRLVSVLARDGARLTHLIIDGYTGYPLVIDNYGPDAKPEAIVEGVKAVLQRVQNRLVWSSRVVQVRDNVAFVAYRPGVSAGDIINICRKGEGILDPKTELQLTWNPGPVAASGRIAATLDNGFMKVELDDKVKGPADEDLVAVKR